MVSLGVHASGAVQSHGRERSVHLDRLVPVDAVLRWPMLDQLDQVVHRLHAEVRALHLVMSASGSVEEVRRDHDLSLIVIPLQKGRRRKGHKEVCTFGMGREKMEEAFPPSGVLTVCSSFTAHWRALRASLAAESQNGSRGKLADILEATGTLGCFAP